MNRDHDNLVRFISQAPIEDFDGVTDRIDGYVLLDGLRFESSAGGPETEFYLEVELASLDTGIGLRNRHMRENYLEVEEYPYATFSCRYAGNPRPGAGAHCPLLGGAAGERVPDPVPLPGSPVRLRDRDPPGHVLEARQRDRLGAGLRAATGRRAVRRSR